MAEDNNWLSNNMEQIEYYLASQNEILIERKRCIDILLRLFSYNFSDRRDLSILDLGCGDGILSQILNDKFPGNRFTLIDGSQVMLSKAKDRMKDGDVTCKQMTFEEFYSEPINDNRFDFVFSSMAIHHLQFAHKEMLFSKIYHELSFDGLFLNIDVVLPESAKSEEWQFSLWRDWIFEKPHENLDTKTKEKHFNIPQIYKNNSENKPSGLIDQLFSLKRIGFRDVDCFYKYGIFSIFGGTK